MRIATLLAVCAVLLSASAASAQEGVAENRSDLRCLLAMGALGQSAQYKQASTIGAFYFAGRLEGRNPGFDLKRAVRQEAGRMGAQEYAGEIRRCGELVRVKGEAMTDMAPTQRGVGR